MVFEPAELEQAGAGKHRRADRPAVQRQPLRLWYRGVQDRIEQMRGDAKPRPHQQVAGDQQRDQPPAIGARPHQRVKPAKQRQRGRQHHRRGHQQPAAGIKQDR